MPTASSNSYRPQIVLHPVHVPQADGTIITYPGKPVVVEETVSTREAARLLGLSSSWVARLCDLGHFATAFKPAGGERSHWRIVRREIEERLAAQAREAR